MLWRIWTFAAGAPPGLAVALAALAAPTPRRVLALAAAGGVLLLLAASFLTRVRSHEPERVRHVAGAASWGWAGLPFAAAAWLGWGPGPGPYAIAAVALPLLAMVRAALVMAPGPPPIHWGLRAAGAAGLGAVAAVAAAALSGFLGRAPAPPERWTDTVYDLDARVATRPLPRCAPRVVEAEVVLDRGAHPALGAGGRVLWFDAESGGVRQLHRLDRDNGEVRCWTCDEPGANVRPAVDPSGNSVAFESDRHASWRHPHDVEIHLIDGRPREGQNFSRRITFHPGPDVRPVLGPAGLLMWSRRESGRYRVVAAALRTGHGGLLLGRVQPLVDGRGAWVAPLAWSPDARHLAVARGNPFGPLEALALDPATGERVGWGDDVAPAASFGADGGWVAYAATRPARVASRVPAVLGGLLAPFARTAEGALRRQTGLRTGASPGPGTDVELGEGVASWGEPTGLALEPDGTGLVLGQRRPGAVGVEERLLRLALDCAPPDPAAPAEPRS